MARHDSRAQQLVGLVEEALGVALPVRLRAWDGSEAGASARTGVPVVVVRQRRALRHLVWSPGELGLARAYVRGDIDVEGDLDRALALVWGAVRDGGDREPDHRPVTAGLLARGLATAARVGALGPPPRRPAAESRLRGRLHSRDRDSRAIAHHYDLSNDFYALLLDSRLTYSCAFWIRDEPAYALEEAQHDKLELVCRKLGLRPGARLLDVGCGWGALALHAAEHHGARVTGVTLSVEQQRWVDERAAERGLSGQVEVRLQHHAELADDDSVRGVDAVGSLETGEHVGETEYAGFARTLHDAVRPGGRVLVQQMSRRDVAPGGGAFIETYIAPDMHMRPVADTVGMLADAGLEVRDVQAMREHYVRTAAAWARRLEDGWDRAVELVGTETARAWRLYLAGGALSFGQNRMGVDQVLCVRPTNDGASLMPASPLGWLAP